MTNHNITTILQELYQIDPSLREHEDALTKAIGHLMESRSAITVDQAFVRQLRSEVVSRAHAMSDTVAPSGFWYSFANMNTFSSSIGGAVIIALLVIGFQQAYNENNALTVASRTSITEVGNNAFGELQFDQGGRGGGGGGGPAASAPSTLKATDQTAAAPAQPSIAVGEGTASTGKIAIYPYIQYRYVYKGEPLDLKTDTVDVLRRIRPLGTDAPSASLIDKLGMGLLNIDTFKNLKIQSLNLFEDHDYGYMINFDMNEGMVSVNEYWNKWPQLYVEGYQPIKPADAPADDEVIRIANDFVHELGIDTSHYGTPVVQDDWRVYLAAAPAVERSSIMAPEQISVIYPLAINGKEVYEQGGSKTGFIVNVNIRQKRASGLWSLTTQQYQSSPYAAETDAKEIIRMAEDGGPQMYHILEDSNAKIIKAELGTPTMGYVHMWNYTASNDSSELLVPALVFPIINNPAELSNMNNIIIPLAKDLLKAQGGMGSGGIMPLPADVRAY